MNFITLAVLLSVISLLVETAILAWVVKLFHFPRPRFIHALVIIVLSELASAIMVGILQIFDLPEVISGIAAVVTAFAAFHYLLRRRIDLPWLKSAGIYLSYTVITLVLSLAVLLPARAWIAEPFAVKGDSMSPTFKDGDYILVKKFSNNYQRGAVIALKNPSDEEEVIIKRIVGMPGETLELRDGKISANGEVLGQPYVTGPIEGNLVMTLSDYEYFVLSDNLASGIDSRSFGAVGEDDFVGEFWQKFDAPGSLGKVPF